MLAVFHCDPEIRQAMTMNATLSAMVRPMSLVLEDKALLPEPLLAVALYDFEGEPEMAELTFAKGQMLMVFCEDFGASWSLAMLVDARGNELTLDEDESGDGSPKLTRGLIAQGFYEYVSEPASRPSSQERHQSVLDSRDEPYQTAPPSPTNTLVATIEVPSHTLDEGGTTQDASSAYDVLDNPSAIPAVEDISTDYLDESSIESSVVIVTSDDRDNVEVTTTAPLVPVPTEAKGDVEGISDTELHAPQEEEQLIPEESQTVPSPPRSVTPLAAPAAHNERVRGRQTSTNSLLKSSNPVEAYLHSDLPFEPEESLNARDVIEIEDGQWVAKIPPFHISVPSYSQRRVAKGRGEYTVFQIVSSITASPTAPVAETDAVDNEENDQPVRASQIRQITVDRRYTHFQHLHTILKASLPLLTLPDLPEKRLTGNFNADFLNGRRKDLERYLSRLARHNLVRSNRAFLDFVGSENEEAYDANLPRTLMHALRTEPERFFTRIKYESDHFDEQVLLEEVQGEQERMARHVRAVEKGQATSAIYDGLTAYRERMQGTGIALSDIAISLISLVSGLAQPKGSVAPTDEAAQPESADRTKRRRERAKAHNMQNGDGAFCWRDGCIKCLGTTKAVQETAEAIALVGDLYDANARTVLLAPQEQLTEYSLPRQRYQNLLTSAKLAQDHLSQLLNESSEDNHITEVDSVKKRSEVVLNSIQAEIEQIHTERREDLQRLALTVLNGQIAFHERALAKLQVARAAFEPVHLEELAQEGARLPSILEKLVLDPPKAKPPLPKASTYGLPAAPSSVAIRPITSLVSILFSGAVGLSGSWRSALSAIKAQSTALGTGSGEDLRERLGSPTLASSSRFVQFLDWTMNSRGEQRQYA